MNTFDLDQKQREWDASRSGGTYIDADNPPVSAGQTTSSPYRQTIWDGDKFSGGFGVTQLLTADYWTLRQRSSQLFSENLYALGLIRRLITNEINTGLTPEAMPSADLLGISSESLNDWTDTVEAQLKVWADNPQVCDHFKICNFAEIQRSARMEALISGDVLVVLRQSQQTSMPTVELVSGNRVRTPLALSAAASLRKGHTIKHGVELDTMGRVVAHWVTQAGGKHKRIPAVGEKTGRRISWLVYGTELRLDEVRGKPLLSIVLQSLREIDRYRDSTQRKAVINSIIAGFVKKGSDKPSSLPITGGAVRKDTKTVTDGGTDKTREFGITHHHPGMYIEELQEGEEIVQLGGNGTDVAFGTFEEAIIQAVAWANQIPPEILRLAFSSNYSASQAALNEFNIYLGMVWAKFGADFCQPIYNDWLISSALARKIEADGLLEAWRNPSKYLTYGAWVAAEWLGTVKISSDPLKQIRAATARVEQGFSNRARESRMMTGTKYTQNIKRLKRENEMLMEAQEPVRSAESGENQPAALAGNVAAAVADELEMRNDD